MLDTGVTVALGEHGGPNELRAALARGRSLAAVAAAGIVVLRRLTARGGERTQRAILLIASTGVLDLLGHAIAGAAGVDVFNSRYLTILIPLTAMLGAVAVVGTQRRTILVAEALHPRPTSVAGRALRDAAHPAYTVISCS